MSLFGKSVTHGGSDHLRMQSFGRMTRETHERLGRAMRVLVTGGTGFVGSHSVKALVDAGHEVRLLVRSPDRIAPALRPYGLDDREHVVGDVTDPGAVERALDGPRTPCAAGCRCCLGARCRSRTCATSPRCTRPCSSGLPINFEGPWLTANAGRMDASATERDLGVRFRPPAESLADTYCWLGESGLVSRRQAGRLGAHTS